MTYCYINGKIVPQNKAHLPLTDIGLLRGYAVFDFLRTFNGKPFLVNEHLQRFWASSKTLGIKIPVTKQKLKQIITKLLKKNGFKESSIRIFITGGQLHGILGFTPHQPTFFILVGPIHPLPQSYYETGVGLVTQNLQRELHHAKTSNYISAAKWQKEAQKAGAFETLYVYQGKVLEAATSNIFLVFGKKLITPKNGVLIGRTRNLVIRLAKKQYKIVERDITVEDLKKADEVFLTATLKDILPVVRVNSYKVGGGRVGPVTRHLMSLHHEFVKKY